MTPVLIIIAFISIATNRIWTLYKRHSRSSPTALSSESLTSPYGDANLSKLESDVILSAIASNLLPPSPDGKEKDRIGPDEAVRVIQDFGEMPKQMRRWKKVRKWVMVFGAVVWMGLDGTRGVLQHRWRVLMYPVSAFSFPRLHRVVAHADIQIFNLVIVLIPNTPVEILLTIHVIPTILLLRSAIIQPHTQPLVIASMVLEIVYWAALFVVPYGEGMSRLLKGSVSRGGGSAGSYGHQLPRHVEEPSCESGCIDGEQDR